MAALVITASLTLAVLMSGSGSAPWSNIVRRDSQRLDLTISGREVVQVRVEFAQGAAFPQHTHPGEEIVYVLSGSLEYEIEGFAQ